MHLFCVQELEGEIKATKQELDDTKAVSTDIGKENLPVTSWEHNNNIVLYCSKLNRISYKF